LKKKGMDPKRGEYIDGRDTQPHLEAMGRFRKLSENDPLLASAKRAALKLAQNFGGSLLSSASFWVIT